MGDENELDLFAESLWSQFSLCDGFGKSFVWEYHNSLNGICGYESEEHWMLIP